MKYLKPDEATVLYEKETAGCPDTGLYPHWKNAKTLILALFSGIALLYANLVIVKHTDEMYTFFHVEKKWQMLLCWGLFMLVYLVAQTAVHELLHVIVLPHKLKTVTVTVDLPHTVSIGNGQWQTKTEALISLIAPVVGITLLAVLPTFLSGHRVLAGFLMIVNVGGASSDIYAFFYLLRYLPRGAIIYGHRYKTKEQIESEAACAGDARATLETRWFWQYANGQEENRLFSSKANETEFLVTLHYIHEYVKPGDKVIDIGAGMGAYVKKLAEEGFAVDALDLHPVNAEKMRDTFRDAANVRVFQADARDLSDFRENAYDLALLMGPVYHLHETEDRLKAISEAVRVVRPGAPVFVAFCLQDAPLLQYVFQCVEPAAMLKTIGYDRETATVTENTGSSIKVETIDSVNGLIDRACAELPVKRGPLFAQDGLSHVLRDNVNNMSEDSYTEWVQYLTATAERRDLMGFSNHVVQVLIKE